MKKKILFFDGDGTLWYPSATKRTKMPWHIYQDEATKDNYLPHMEATPLALETIALLKRAGFITVILSTHPDDLIDRVERLQEKAGHFGFHAVFDHIYATSDNPEAKGVKIIEVLNEYGFSKDDALMVGDSYRYDYQSAKAVGVEAVLINSDYYQEVRHDKPVDLLIDEVSDLIPLLEMA